jgi:hypothetical protein
MATMSAIRCEAAGRIAAWRFGAVMQNLRSAMRIFAAISEPPMANPKDSRWQAGSSTEIQVGLLKCKIGNQ